MENSSKINSRSISPSLLKSLSPVRTTSRLMNFVNTKEKIANISKSVFKTDVDQHPILTLEKAVLRGKGNEDSERKIWNKTKNKKTSKLELYLKAQHKIKNQGTQIVRLPKLPYGNHHSYNEEHKFVNQHFVSENSGPEEKKELYNLTRKFKLKERIKSKRNHSHSMTSTKKNDDTQIYSMDAGILVVAKENEIVQSYENDRNKYVVKHHYVYQTFRDVDLNLDMNFSPKTMDKRISDQDQLLKRLYKTPSKKHTELARLLTTKYSALFNK